MRAPRCAPMWSPLWLQDASGLVLRSDEEAMAHAVALARENVERRTGGPFGAVIVRGDGAVVAQGVNGVERSGISLAHAELVALLAAQERQGRARLNDDAPGSPWTLVTTAQPCVMCHGALFWAGLDALVVGARSSDVEELTGFDEGPVPDTWEEQLASRGIAVRKDVLRDECRAVLSAYAERGGTLY
jgi:tRNA(Arg) A34 adenosine deaminase TadA